MKVLGDGWINPQILSIQSLEAHQHAEAMKVKAAADHAHNLVDEEKACILLQVTDANCKSRSLRIQQVMQAQREFIMGITTSVHPPERDTQTGVSDLITIRTKY